MPLWWRALKSVDDVLNCAAACLSESRANRIVASALACDYCIHNLWFGSIK
jgi:hypothetical protein